MKVTFVYFRFNFVVKMSSFVESKMEDAKEDDMDDTEEEFDMSEKDSIIDDYLTKHHQNIHWKVTRTQNECKYLLFVITGDGGAY